MSNAMAFFSNCNWIVPFPLGTSWSFPAADPTPVIWGRRRVLPLSPRNRSPKGVSRVWRLLIDTPPWKWSMLSISSIHIAKLRLVMVQMVSCLFVTFYLLWLGLGLITPVFVTFAPGSVNSVQFAFDHFLLHSLLQSHIQIDQTP